MTQISLGIHPVWSESSLCAQWVAKDPRFLHADSKDSDQTGRMPRLIWVFAGSTCYFVSFVMRQLGCILARNGRFLLQVNYDLVIFLSISRATSPWSDGTWRDTMSMYYIIRCIIIPKGELFCMKINVTRYIHSLTIYTGIIHFLYTTNFFNK